MKKWVYYFIIGFIVTSCATMVNKPYQKVVVSMTQPGVIIYGQDTVSTKRNRTTLKVERQNKDLVFNAVTDSITKTVTVPARNSAAYWMNIPTNYGIGLLLEKDLPKRYGYPNTIYLTSEDTAAVYYHHNQVNRKGEINMHLALPYVNSFQLTPQDENTKITTGFWGVTVGLDYYHSTDQYINLSYTGVSDFFLPLPAPFTYDGYYELMSSTYYSVSNNHKVNRFTVGYGISYARNFWRRTYQPFADEEPPADAYRNTNNYALGIVVPAYFQVGRNFNIGLVYRPTFYRPGVSDSFKYEHIISFDLAWKIRLFKI